MKHTLQLIAGAALLATASHGQTTNIVYSINPTPPIAYKTGYRLMLQASWVTTEDARGFALLRFISPDPESVASPAFSMMLNANGTFDMIPADRAPTVNLQNLTAGGVAASHNVALQIYPSSANTKITGDFWAVWPHPLDTTLSGAEILICGEGLTLATLEARWAPNPTLFLLK